MLERLRDLRILGLSRASQGIHSSRECVYFVTPAQPPSRQPGILLSKSTVFTYRLSESMYSVLRSCVRARRSSAQYRVDRRKVDNGAALRHPPPRPIVWCQSSWCQTFNQSCLQSNWLLRAHLTDLVLCAQDHTQNVHLHEALELCRICFGDRVNLATYSCCVADPLQSV